MKKVTAAQIEAFNAVMICGTTVAAADVLNTSQPSISRALHQLDAATGLELFERKQNRLTPTKDALKLYEVVRIYFHGLEKITKAAEKIRRTKNEQLIISCAPALTGGFFARTLADLKIVAPNLHVSMKPLMSREIIDALQRNEIDAGVAQYDVSAVSISSQLFTSCDEVILLPTASPLAQKPVISIADLDGIDFIKLADKDPYTKRLFSHFTKRQVQPNVVAEAETSASACSMVREKIGVTIVNPITGLDFISSEIAMRSLDISLPFVTCLHMPENAINQNNLKLFSSVIQNRLKADLIALQNILQK